MRGINIFDFVGDEVLCYGCYEAEQEIPHSLLRSPSDLLWLISGIPGPGLTSTELAQEQTCALADCQTPEEG
jgi:hypothetical protein